MKISVRLLLASAACLIFVSPALARKPAAQPAIAVAGVYENFTVGKGSGDSKECGSSSFRPAVFITL
jgi:hypothetical protein